MDTVVVKDPSLVLSGGGMKAAAFHIGVSLALEKFQIYTYEKGSEQIELNRFVGASAGSVIASFFAQGYTPQDVIYAFTQGKHDLDTLEVQSLTPQRKLPALKYRDIFNLALSKPGLASWLPSLIGQQIKGADGLESLLKSLFTISGFFNTKGLAKYFNENVFASTSPDFSDIAKDLFIVATFLDKPQKAIFSKYKKPKLKTTHDEAEYITNVSVSEAISASAALPPIFTPIEINGEVFFDGEVRDSLNSHIALDQGSDLVIVSYSMQPYRFNEALGSLNNYGLPVIANQALYQLIQQKIMNHIKAKLNLSLLFKELESSLAQHLPKETIEEIVFNLEKSYFKSRRSKVLYIHPSSQDHEMFFADHLSLKPSLLNKIVTIGFKAAMNSLRQYKFVKA